MKDQIFTTTQAANYCGVSASYLANRRVYGGGPLFVKLRAKVSYRQSDLDAWLLENSYPDRASIPEDHISRDSKPVARSDDGEA